MNESTYLKRMMGLSAELKRTTAAEPYDPDTYNNVVDKMNMLNHRWHVSLSRKRWFVRVVWILLVLLFAWLIFFGRHYNES